MLASPSEQIPLYLSGLCPGASTFVPGKPLVFFSSPHLPCSRTVCSWSCTLCEQPAAEKRHLNCPLQLLRVIRRGVHIAQYVFLLQQRRRRQQECGEVYVLLRHRRAAWHWRQCRGARSCPAVVGGVKGQVLGSVHPQNAGSLCQVGHADPL